MAENRNDLIVDGVFGGPTAKSRNVAKTYKHRAQRPAATSTTVGAGTTPLTPAKRSRPGVAPATAANTTSVGVERALLSNNENAKAKTPRPDRKGKGKAASGAEPSTTLVLGSRTVNTANVTGGTPKHKLQAQNPKHFLSSIRLPLSPLTVFKDSDAPPSSPSDMSISPTSTIRAGANEMPHAVPSDAMLAGMPMQTPAVKKSAEASTAVAAADMPFIGEVFRNARPLRNITPQDAFDVEIVDPLSAVGELSVGSAHTDDEEDPIAAYGDGEFANLTGHGEATPPARRLAHINISWDVDPLPPTSEEDDLTAQDLLHV
ncbi:hypothetical protein HDU86_005219 [Geranomyces michiganensis]|nr:hypothetical protein HDU86_005219 [Geranomyces michiganensis]